MVYTEMQMTIVTEVIYLWVQIEYFKYNCNFYSSCNTLNILIPSKYYSLFFLISTCFSALSATYYRKASADRVGKIQN